MAPAEKLYDANVNSKEPIANGSEKLDKEPAPPAKETESYVVADPQSRRHGSDHRGAFHYAWDAILGHDDGKKGQITYSDKIQAKGEANQTWQAKISVVCLKILFNIYAPMKAFGQFVEDILNLFVANGGVIRTFYHIFFPWAWYKLVILDRQHADYKSFLALLDPRVELYTDFGQNPDKIDQANAEIFPGTQYGSQFTADVLVMASKIAYENANSVNRTVGKTWKMNFVGFWDCWNEFQGEQNTQVFIFTDRPVDARAVVVAWRGTEPFNTLDWSTDFDFSWLEIKGLGKVHVGFLEALGLGDRNEMETFVNMQKSAASRQRAGQHEVGDSNLSGLSNSVKSDKYKRLAYDYVTKRLKALMRQHQNAKLFVTGHSLGGALANLYTGLLFFNEEEKLTSRIAAVYTFGQPRVGAKDYSDYLIGKLTTERYWRVVYSNDLVPRIPFDGPIFQFKHSGYCYFYDERHTLATLEDVPNPNYFTWSISDFFKHRIEALYDLILSVFAGWIYGPKFREGWIALAVRSTGIIMPGMCGHLLNNYVNAVRLGPTVLDSKLNKHKYGLFNWIASFLGAQSENYSATTAHHGA
ncbi:hypothetical protein R1sor_024574 [Riccia sorocarpa]|uniref:Fungal lipase-type domain-containing protein n=1 Tax=Riccia sorocarpa TaxID=122646 RepID=A0ABD3GQX8_9MARC